LRAVVEPATAADVPAAIARARYIAEQAPCGPTFVSIPADDWEQPAEPVPQRTVSRSVRGDAALLAQLAAALAAAEKPVFVAGSGVSRDGAYAALTRLAEQHEAPVWTAPRTARAAFPESHRLFAGFLPNSRESVAACLAGHDLIVVFGAPVFTYHMAGSGPFIPAGANLFQLGDNPGQSAWAAVGTAIVTSLQPAIEELLASALPLAVRAAGQGRGAAPAPEPASSGDGVGVAWLMSRLAALRPADSLLVEEAPSSRLRESCTSSQDLGGLSCGQEGVQGVLPER
jgi:benzoylformate decarboxylase